MRFARVVFLVDKIKAKIIRFHVQHDSHATQSRCQPPSALQPRQIDKIDNLSRQETLAGILPMQERHADQGARRRHSVVPIIGGSTCSLAGRPGGEGTMPPGHYPALRVSSTDCRPTRTFVATKHGALSPAALPKLGSLPPADCTLTPAHWCRHAALGRRSTAALPSAAARPR